MEVEEGRRLSGSAQRRSLALTLEGSHWLTCILLSLQIELGTACGKLFRCSTLAILDAGDSDILSDQTA